MIGDDEAISCFAPSSSDRKYRCVLTKAPDVYQCSSSVYCTKSHAVANVEGCGNASTSAASTKPVRSASRVSSVLTARTSSNNRRHNQTKIELSVNTGIIIKGMRRSHCKHSYAAHDGTYSLPGRYDRAFACECECWKRETLFSTLPGALVVKCDQGENAGQQTPGGGLPM